MIWQLIVLQVVTFGVLVFLLRQFLYQQVTHSQDRLEQLVQENRKREQGLKDKREEMENEFKTRMTEHNEKMAQLLAATEAESQRKKEQILQEAEKDGKMVLAEAETYRDRIKSQIVAEMEEKAMNLAADIIGCVFSARLARGIHAELADELIEEIDKNDGNGLQLDAEVVEVSVPFSLSEEQLERIRNSFSTKMERQVKVIQTIDEGLMTGMVIRVGNSVLDGSLRNKIKGAMTYVRSNLAR